MKSLIESLKVRVKMLEYAYACEDHQGIIRNTNAIGELLNKINMEAIREQK